MEQSAYRTRKVKQVLFGVSINRSERVNGEVKKDEYGLCTLYIYVKIKP
jgi:hypothetical protein